MFKGIRIRIMIAALVFALAWALGVAVHSVTYVSFTIICLGIGSTALAYLVWEYHRAWRLRPLSPGRKFSTGFRNWSGVSVYSLRIRPEYVTAALALLICLIGIYKYLQFSSLSSMPTIPKSPPSLLLPESRPLQ
jgi:hypothetical protein